MKGTTANTDHMSTVMKAKDRRWLGTVKIARSCSTGRRRGPGIRCDVNGGMSRIAARATTALKAASDRKGARHEKCAAIHSDNGTPAIAESEKAAATTAVAVARRSQGTRSATIVNVRPPSTP